MKERIWGGNKLMTLFNKPSDLENIGESWELSDVEGDTSIVSNGALQGMSLKELLSNYGADLVGTKVYGQFS